MDRRLATLLTMPAVAVFSAAALAGTNKPGSGAANVQHPRPQSAAVERHRPQRPEPKPVRRRPRQSAWTESVRSSAARPGAPSVRRDPPRLVADYRRPRYGSQGRDGDRRDPPPRYYGHDDRDDRDRDAWRGRPYRWHGQVYWRLDIRTFPRFGLVVWQRGRWYQGWHGRRWGWWWLAGGAWYYYPAPIYPYPNPYVPGSVVVVTSQPSPPPAPAQAPVQYWYHCNAPEGYYPYVPECAGGWTPVPATPAPSVAPAPPAPPTPPVPQPQQPPQYWYYCSAAHGYYPSVPQCPGGWTPVPVTQPPSAPPPGLSSPPPPA